MAKFQFFSPDRQTTDRRLTDGQNRLLNPASRMRARGNELHQTNTVQGVRPLREECHEGLVRPQHTC